MLPDHHHHHHHHHHQHSYQYKHQLHPPPSPPSSPSSGSSGKTCCGLRKPLRRCCCNCPGSVSSSVFTCLGVCVLVLGYTLLGAFTFMAIEGGYKDAARSGGSGLVMGEEVRARTVEKLWSITEDLNILYKDNWTRLAAQEVLKFQDTLVRNLRGGSVYYNFHHHRWSFSSSFLYSLTLITTIGYGSVAPRTPWGKIITIVYALIGIPLMLVYLSTVGDVLARSFRRLYGRLCGNGSCNSRNKNSSSSTSSKSKLSSTESYLSTGYTPSSATKAHNNITADGSVIKLHHHHHYRPEEGNVLDCGGDAIGASSSTPLDPGGKVRHRYCDLGDQVRVPISLCLMIILMYICGGALLFNRLENWSFLEGSYFCFTSLGTIGFGDLIPGLLQYHSSAEQLSVFASSAYILVGMALIAMCFNLVQDEVVILVRRLAQYFGVAREGEVVVEGEGVAMAVVSTS